MADAGASTRGGDIAVVGWAQTPMVRRTDKSETQLLMDAITDALAPLGLTRADIDFTCLGSCDYITGQAFSFVSNLDAIGAWPPKRDSHVEMDGAWALYEAWLRLQEGDIEIAVVTGSGRSSTGDPALIYPMEMDPYFLAPLGRRPADVRRPAGPGRDRRRYRRRAVDGRGGGTLPGQRRGRRSCWPSDYVRQPLRRHDIPPITDGAAAMVLATGDRARNWSSDPPTSPASTIGPSATTRRSGRWTTPRPPAWRPRPAGPRRRPGRGGRAAGRLHPRGAAAATRCSAWAGTWRSTRPAAHCGQPDHGHRAVPHRLRRRPRDGWRPPGARPFHLGALPAAEPRLHRGGGRHERPQPVLSSASARPTTSRDDSTSPSAAWCVRRCSGPSTTPR